MTNENDSLLRIEKLESSNRRIKWYLGLYILTSIPLIVLPLMRASRQAGQTFEAREFLVRDKSGHVTARLGSSPVGTCLEILGESKEATATLCAGDKSGSDLLLTTHHAASRALLSAGGKIYESADGTVLPTLMIAEEGEGIVTATVGADSALALGRRVGQKAPAIDVLDGNGKTLWTAP